MKTEREIFFEAIPTPVLSANQLERLHFVLASRPQPLWLGMDGAILHGRALDLLLIGMDPQQALDAPRFRHLDGNTHEKRARGILSRRCGANPEAGGSLSRLLPPRRSNVTSRNVGMSPTVSKGFGPDATCQAYTISV